ncbi:hypothetical protein BGM26_13280 [Bacillus sp. FJAT-29790]|uniref:hypothetical protein n=1 Tax=Bacillus sp. FJAT-29790 TaxID=1895002 RepID=UPI001C21DDBA|nr:hypothetical protein [Bacillus sp. FJAT-29790]MBU8879951.1 hypothetical protein [Bacillus sp. FJAT-29790]
MSIIVTLLPLALIISLIIFLTAKSRRKFVTVKITHWLLMIYVGVLLISMVAAPFMTEGVLISREKVQEKDIDTVSNDLYNSLSEGKLDEIDRKYLLSENSFDYQNPTLKVFSHYDYGLQVFVERKTSDDGKIEAYYYTGNLIINGMDFSDKLEPSRFQMNGNTFTIWPPEETHIKISMIKKEFTITQFNGEPGIGNMVSHAPSIAYLRIPKNLELIDESDISLQYVGE